MAKKIVLRPPKPPASAGVAPEGPLVVVAFDVVNNRYSVNGGPWQENAMNDDGAFLIERCLRSRQSGHTSHCHEHVWNGARWIDKGHGFPCGCP
jgi:hypothetical protein